MEVKEPFTERKCQWPGRLYHIETLLMRQSSHKPVWAGATVSLTFLSMRVSLPVPHTVVRCCLVVGSPVSVRGWDCAVSNTLTSKKYLVSRETCLG